MMIMPLRGDDRFLNMQHFKRIIMEEYYMM